MSKRPRRNHSAAFKAKVAIEALADGKTIAEVAQKHDVWHPSRAAQFVKVWRKNDRCVSICGQTLQDAHRHMTIRYARDVLRDLYSEGDRDIVFLDYLLGLIKYDEKNAERNINPQIIHDNAIALVEFLTASGDFSLRYLGVQEFEEEINLKEPKGFSRFSIAVKELIAAPLGNNQLTHILKKNRIGKAIDHFPFAILKILM